MLISGDYNMTPDRHLGAAHVLPGLKPDLLISESTYATTIRDSKRARYNKNEKATIIHIFYFQRARFLEENPRTSYERGKG